MTAASSGASGVNGATGIDGSTGALAKNLDGQSCKQADHASGGVGGAITCAGIVTHGGQGGTRVCPDAPGDVQNANQSPQAQEHGATGQNNLFGAGAGGEAGWDLLVGFSSCGVCSSSKNHASDGADGLNGLPGPNGETGNVCANSQGSVNANGLWVGSMGGAGDAGAGSGAGGGAARSAVPLPACASCDARWGALGGVMASSGLGSGVCGLAGVLRSLEGSSDAAGASSVGSS